jgi:hypothetical protein
MSSVQPEPLPAQTETQAQTQTKPSNRWAELDAWLVEVDNVLTLHDHITKQAREILDG